MSKCPIPWCGQEIPKDQEHDDHQRWATDPEYEYYAVSEATQQEVKTPTREALRVFRRPRERA